MTRKEAKAYIIRHCNPDYPKGNTEWEQAMNMAIKALEQPESQWIPCSERLPRLKFSYADCEWLDEKDGQIVPMNAFEVYESEPVLITGEYIDITTKTSGVFTAQYYKAQYTDGRTETWWADNAAGELDYNAVAWMPLSEPYTE